MTDPEPPRAEARIVVLASTSGVAVAWPLLVVDRCPFAVYQGHGHPHAHVHTLTAAAPPPWRKAPPCCRDEYLVYLEAAA